MKRRGARLEAGVWVVTAVGGRQLVSQGRTRGFGDMRRGGAGEDTALGWDYCGPVSNFTKQRSIHCPLRPVTRVKQVDPSSSNPTKQHLLLAPYPELAEPMETHKEVKANPGQALLTSGDSGRSGAVCGHRAGRH